jgi:hypothetical protein
MEKIIGILVTEVSLRPEMIVDEIEDDREAAQMTRVNQRAKIIGRAIGMRGRE